MSNSPVQIVLNTNDFISKWERPAGGGNKDFYEGSDKEFIAHKEKLSEQLVKIKGAINNNEFSEISYAKLILKQSALAKSHRPSTALFNPKVAPIVGGGDLGELYVELQPDSIDQINELISKAENDTKWKIDKNGKKKAAPSKLRSEVGSIEEITHYTAFDKRSFSVKEGLDWLLNPQTGGAYIIELFETPPLRQNWDNLTPEKYRLFHSFLKGLEALGDNLTSSRVELNQKGISIIGVRLEDTSVRSNKISPTRSSIYKRTKPVFPLLQNLEIHGKLLDFLDKHPLVKKINLPPIISKSNSPIESSLKSAFELPKLVNHLQYPKIAIVDGGISEILGDWIEDKWGILSSKDKDEAHGTFIAGILVAGRLLNGNSICEELDGCKIIDLDILPNKDSFEDYFPSILDFFNELETAVKELVGRTGVRVFNFSLNIEEHVSSDGYSHFAKILDRIAEENDVIFIISAGNIGTNDFRKEWPTDPTEALKILAAARNDIIKKPAESSRNISVAALNPPNLEGLIPFAPSTYSCRGPGLRVGVKPDLAHVGGSETNSPSKGSGLQSLDINGFLVDGCGTSYAAPHVAKTIASLDHQIEGFVSRESLIGLTVHNAAIPKILQHDQLKEVAKHLVGFGMPIGSQQILEGNDHSITLVFANRLHNNKKLSFSFSWPPSLTTTGKCSGDVRLTVVSTPSFNYRYGAEFVRINIEGHLRQEDSEGKFKGRLASIYAQESEKGQKLEKNQIAHSLKWSPIKVYENKFERIGNSSNWRLDIEYLLRDDEIFPEEGVPFTAILSITDPQNKKPVFNEMRQSLQSLGVRSVDIRTAARIVPRV